MIFETERLLARRWVEEDAEAAFEMYGNPEVMRFLGSEGAKATIPSLEAMRERMPKMIARYSDPQLTGYGSWALVEKASGEVVGASLLKPLPDAEGVFTSEIEVGWHLIPRHWGKGFATEGARGAMKYGFEHHGLEKIYAIVYPENARSIAVMHRLGMTHLGLTDRYYGVTVELFEAERGGP